MKSAYLIIGIISLLVIGVVIFGFSVAGSPFETRARKVDQERVSNISSLKLKIDSYYKDKGSLPDSLDKLTLSTYDSDITKDPETDEEYEYSTSGQTTYKICATFSTASDEKKDPYRYSNKDYEHPKGRHCFDLEVPSYSQKNTLTTKKSTGKATTILDKKIKTCT